MWTKFVSFLASPRLPYRHRWTLVDDESGFPASAVNEPSMLQSSAYVTAQRPHYGRSNHTTLIPNGRNNHTTLIPNGDWNQAAKNDLRYHIYQTLDRSSGSDSNSTSSSTHNTAKLLGQNLLSASVNHLISGGSGGPVSPQENTSNPLIDGRRAADCWAQQNALGHHTIKRNIVDDKIGGGEHASAVLNALARMRCSWKCSAITLALLLVSLIVTLVFLLVVGTCKSCDSTNVAETLITHQTPESYRNTDVSTANGFDCEHSKWNIHKQ